MTYLSIVLCLFENKDHVVLIFLLFTFNILTEQIHSRQLYVCTCKLYHIYRKKNQCNIYLL